MDPQAPNVSINPVEDPVKPMIPDTSSKIPADNHWISILAMAIFVLFALGVVAFLYYQNQQLKKMLVSYQPTPVASPLATISPSPSPDPEIPVVSSPSSNTKITSPLKISGKVPAGWMFEGVFPIKLVDSNKKLIVQAQAKEILPGSWQTEGPVNFTATLIFKASSGSGTLILENDNPSGILTNLKTFEIPVKFQ